MSIEGDLMQPAMIETGVTEQVIETPQAETQLPERTMSNEEVMVAQALSKIKKTAKILERTNKTLGQVLDSLKRSEKESATHARQVTAQNKKLMAQLAKLEKRVVSIKTTVPKPKAARKSKNKRNTRRKVRSKK
jgi:Mg2+ and Co2+ transporter CorA